MSPGLCEKSLQDAEEGLASESLLQEQRIQLLNNVPSQEELSGTAQEEAHLLEGSRRIEIKPKQTEEQPKNNETGEERKCHNYKENREERGPFDEEEGGIGRSGGKDREEPGGGGGGGEGGGGGKREENTRNKGNRLDCNEIGHIGRYKNYFQRYRDLVAYWCLGFCNNFTYWVMITAAYDLLTPEFQAYHERAQADTHETTLVHANEETREDDELYGVLTLSDIETTTTYYSESSRQNESVHEFVNTFECQKHSTGVILVADTLPATALTLAVPLTLMLPVNTRVWLVSLLCGASYLTLGLAHPKWVFLGVAFASASRGFSDSTFLGHASYYHKHVLSMWSSGTGVATFIGPMLYSSLTTWGLDPRHVLLIFLAIPLITAASFWCLLSKYEEENGSGDNVIPDDRIKSTEDTGSEKQKFFIMVQEKLTLFMRAQKYIMPLSVFYLIMYITNQGLLELVYFPTSMFTHAQQYSWSNTVRCLGTLISRSAHHFMLLPSSWIYVALALAILCIVGTEAHYHYLPSEYIIFTLLLVQGLVEGAAFRSSVFNIHNKTSEKDLKFCLAVFPTSLFLPALVAGLISMPLHEVLCQNHMYKN